MLNEEEENEILDKTKSRKTAKKSSKGFSKKNEIDKKELEIYCKSHPHNQSNCFNIFSSYKLFDL